MSDVEFLSVSENKKKIDFGYHLKSIWAFITLSIPLICIQLSNFGKGMVDVIMVGHYDSANLAGMALATGIFSSLATLAYGFTNSNVSIFSNLHAQKDYKKLHYFVYQSLYLNIAMSVTLSVVFYNSGIVINQLDITQQTKDIVINYLKVMAFVYPFFNILTVLRPIMQTFMKDKVLMVVLVSMSLMNIPLNYLFIYSFDMGAVGSAIATASCFSIEVIIVLYYITLDKRTNFFRTAMPKINVGDIKSLFLAGYSVGLGIMSEIGVDTMIVFLLTKYGEIVIAGHQVVVSYTSIIFAAGLGVRFVLMRKISFLIGLKQYSKLKIETIHAFCVALIIAAIFSVAFLFYGNSIVSIYSDDVEVLKVAKSLVYITIIYQVFNILISIPVGVLRGLLLNGKVLKITLFSYVLFGLIVGYLLSLSFGLLGFWIGKILGLIAMFIMGSLLAYRYLFDESKISIKIDEIKKNMNN